MEVIRVTGTISTSVEGSTAAFEVDLDKAEWDRKTDRERHAMVMQALVNQGHYSYDYTTEVVDV